MQTSTPQRRKFRDGPLEVGILGSSSKIGAKARPRSPLTVARAETEPSVVRKSLEVAIVEAGCGGFAEQPALTPQRATTSRPALPSAASTVSEMRCSHHTTSAGFAKLHSEDGRLTDGLLSTLVHASPYAPPVSAEMPCPDVTRAFALERAPEQQVLSSEARELSPPTVVQPYYAGAQVGIARSAFVFCGKFFQC